MLTLNPVRRPSADEIINTFIVDYNKTMLVRKNSDPIMLKTIKAPRDMLRLKQMLPNHRYKVSKQSDNHSLPSIDNSKIVSRPISSVSRPVSRLESNRVQLKEVVPLKNNHNIVNNIIKQHVLNKPNPLVKPSNILKVNSPKNIPVISPVSRPDSRGVYDRL